MSLDVDVCMLVLTFFAVILAAEEYVGLM